MRKIIALATILSVTQLIAFGQSTNQADVSSSNRSLREREKEVLKLFGTAGTGNMSGECPNAMAALSLVDSRKAVEELLQRKDWAERIHEIAKNIACLNEISKCSKSSLYFPIERYTDITKVKEIIGNEDSTETIKANLNGEEINLTLYKFNWLSFGVNDGKVKIVFVNFIRGKTSCN